MARELPMLGAGRGTVAPLAAMRIGDLVIWRGRTYRLLGFDPMSVVDRRAHLEEPETGRRILVQADELEPEAPEESPVG